MEGGEESRGETPPNTPTLTETVQNCMKSYGGVQGQNVVHDVSLTLPLMVIRIPGARQTFNDGVVRRFHCHVLDLVPITLTLTLALTQSQP